MSLANQIAVVTGASRGIGRATALTLAARGATVAVVYRGRRDAADAVVARIRAAGGRADAFQADVADTASVRALADAIRRQHHRIDILVNNAGVFGARPIGELDAAFFDEQFHNNALSVMLATQAFTPLFGERGGVIVNVSSNLAHAPTADTGVYSASKAAVDALTRAFALELGPRRIRVNAVAPFITRTDMTAGIPQPELQAAIAQTPLGRLAEPEDIANAIAALASPDMAWVTGRSLLADGGFTG